MSRRCDYLFTKLAVRPKIVRLYHLPSNRIAPVEPKGG
jgi:hypothetical protein